MAEKNEVVPDKDNQKQVAVRRPFPGFADLREEMNRFWGDGFLPRFWWPGRLANAEPWTPQLDVYEKDGAFHVDAELPGLTDKDIEIQVTDHGLTISGEKEEKKEVKEENYYRSERNFGRFSRRVVLPDGADGTRAEASFKDGVLHIAIPIKEAAKAQKIVVKAG